MLLVPSMRPKGLPQDDLYKLIATLAIWLSCVLLVEFSPMREEPTPVE